MHEIPALASREPSHGAAFDVSAVAERDQLEAWSCVVRPGEAARLRVVPANGSAQRADGVGILLVSSDLSEIWEMADRVMVMTRGRLRGPVPIAETTVQQVGAWMAGQ